jgi:hypothetical protein
MGDDRSTLAVGADGETFPLTPVLTGRGFVTGKSGSGKSNTASVVAEELLEQGLPLLIVDTDGEYYGLKADFELLQIGPGPNCDVSLGVESAREIAELSLVENVPVILDISGFVDQEDGEAFVDAVLKELFALENEHKRPFLVLVEELHEFVPEQRGLPAVGETIIRIAKRGRKRGLGICGMSQRPAAVDKDFITQCNWLVWHRLTWENDTRVVSQIMGGDAAETVQSLGDGEALVLTDWDEQTRTLQFRRKRTFDAGSTPSLAEESRPSLKTVDSDLIDRLRQSETSASGDGDADDSETTQAASASAEADGGGADQKRRQSTPASAQSTDNGLLWEFGQLVWYLVGQFISGLQSVGRRVLAGGNWVAARLAAENQGGTDGRPLTWSLVVAAILVLVVVVVLIG